ncbi:hypothetical protein QL285_074950 [Trifolium repens]|nr:hypothetical protein QL285_074950 [Trifolium repens]
MEEPVSDFLYNHLYIYLSLLLNLWFLFVYIISPEKKIAQREEELERLVMTDSFTVNGWVSGEKQKNIRHVVGERKYSRSELKKKDDALTTIASIPQNSKEMTNLSEKIKMLEDLIKSKEMSLETSASSLLEKESELQSKVDELEDKVEELNQRIMVY